MSSTGTRMQDIRFVVIHRPGPQWDAGKPIFEQAGLAEHIAHYRQWLQQGKLMAGGPFLDGDPAAGMRGWDFRTEEVGGDAALRAFYYGPLAVNAEGLASDQGQERRHVGVINYSYQIPGMNVLLNAGETRDLGKLTLQAGGRTETVNVTAEVTPVQTTSSALQKNLSSDLLTSVQVKGRDVFGMLKILPGVADANPSRDFAQWNSGRYLSINGGNSLNKNTTIDGIPSGEEGGNGTTHITPNIDSVAEVNVVASGYTAENGRQASGQIIMGSCDGAARLRCVQRLSARRQLR